MLSRLFPAVAEGRTPRSAPGILGREGLGLVLRAGAVAVATLLVLTALGLGRVVGP
ncbi:hypothetical protein [Falsiroseomonas ponticola]|jgi:hypothetical protein|uniref:hypothetical protein n=1 Tax=Falsiroseomonas ponticola TaxID=2786951 RepID=UPI00193306F0|nr:hypothetical protein [Roseomonas ponticola]